MGSGMDVKSAAGSEGPIHFVNEDTVAHVAGNGIALLNVQSGSKVCIAFWRCQRLL